MRSRLSPCLGLLLGLVGWMAGSQSLFAQLPQTRLTDLFPAGGQVGQTVEVKIVAGEDLEEVKQLLFNHPGITAVQKTVDANGQPQPVDLTFLVTIAATVPTGLYEAQAIGLWGMTNTRRFQVGGRPEIAEVEPNNESTQATPVPLNSIVNAKLEQGTDVDWYKFTGGKGQRIICELWAARLDSKMEGVIELFDATAHRRLSAVRPPRRGDTRMVFDLPGDGEYLLRVFDQTYRNGNDFCYRLELHAGPVVEFARPIAGLPGTTAKFSLFGFNLPGGQPTDFELHRLKLSRLDLDIPVPALDGALESGMFLPPSCSQRTSAWPMKRPR